MEKQNALHIMEFKIEKPAHKFYKTGVLSFVFDEKTPTVLNKIDFRIDGVLYYINLLRVPRYHLTWIFQKERSLQALSHEELCKILQLVKDVNDVTPFRPPYKNLLVALPQQAEIYLQMMNKGTTKEQKRALAKELVKKNNLLKNVTLMRGKDLGLCSEPENNCNEK